MCKVSERPHPFSTTLLTQAPAKKDQNGALSPHPSLTEGPCILPDRCWSLHRAAMPGDSRRHSIYTEGTRPEQTANLARLSHSQKTTSKSIPCLYLLKQENMILASILFPIPPPPLSRLPWLSVKPLQGMGQNIFMLVKGANLKRCLSRIKGYALCEGSQPIAFCLLLFVDVF